MSGSDRCLVTTTWARVARQPSTIDAWLYASEMTNVSGVTSARIAPRFAR